MRLHEIKRMQELAGIKESDEKTYYAQGMKVANDIVTLVLSFYPETAEDLQDKDEDFLSHQINTRLPTKYSVKEFNAGVDFLSDIGGFKGGLGEVMYLQYQGQLKQAWNDALSNYKKSGLSD